ncbi:MAG: PorP/SprF family type IX secretion system membrane protein [Saprospiraceae bacterium]|nr:PorP/SprF family type IX secretion system membrane protein [Saprospiraceae bacterium]
MRHIFCAFLAFLFVGSLTAQERYFDERYISSLSFLNPVLVNPGATAKDGEHRLLLNYKNTWSSFEGSPQSVILSYDGPVADRLGFGAQLISDSNGDLRMTKAQGQVSYTIDAPVNVIGFGIGAEYINHSLSADALNNTIIDRDDPIVNDRLAGASFFDVSFGIYGVYDGKLSYGISFPSLVSTRIEDTNTESDREIGYIFNLGYIFDKSDVVFEPSIMVKKLNQVPFHADINLLGRFLDDKLRGGITYTVGADEKIGFLVGTIIGNLNFTYAYNASRHEFQTYNNGSHELSVLFQIGKKKDDTSMNTGAGN